MPQDLTHVNSDIDTQMHAVLAGGASLVPVGDDKKPNCKWKEFQTKAPTKQRLNHWLSQGANAFAVICGKVGGGWGCVDFDDNPNYPAIDNYRAWYAKVGHLVEQHGLIVQTTRGNGYQVHYRTDDPGHNAKLAWVPSATADAGRLVAIETRGEGGYAVIAPSFEGKYNLIAGSFANVPYICQDVAERLWAAAKELDLMPVTTNELKAAVKEKAASDAQRYNGSGSVIDTYNQTYDITKTLLGYNYAEAKHGGRLSRPGQPESAGVHILADDNVSFHWSSNDPLHNPKSNGNPYPVKPFDAFCYFEHNGDLKAAVKAAANLLGMTLHSAEHKRHVVGNVVVVAELLRVALDNNHPVDDLRDAVARLSDDERKDSAITEQLQRVMPKQKELDKWLISCGHNGESDAKKLLTEVRRLGHDFTLNVLEDEVEVDGRRLDDVTRSDIYLELMSRPKTYVDDAINVLARENSYHPIQRYLNGLQWDGQDHIARLLECVRVAGPKVVGEKNGFFVEEYSLSHALIVRWLIGCVARGLDGGRSKVFKHQTPVLVFVGGQGAGKSSLVKWLASGVGSEYHVESPVDPEKDEHKRAMVTKWLWEISELGSSLNKSDREAFKGFVTTEIHTYRKPYGRSLIARSTLCNLVGTINSETGFLSDPTGNRRFLPVQVTGIDWTYKDKIDVDQLWAQVVYLYKNGESPELAAGEKKALASVHKKHEVENPLQAFIQMFFRVDPNDQSGGTHTADIILQLKAQGVTLHSSSRTAGREINDALAPLGLTRKQFTSNGVYNWGWLGVYPKR